MTNMQNLVCRTPSSPLRQELSLSLEEQDFLKGNLGHIHMWGWEREGEGECIRSSMRRKEEGLWVTHREKPSQWGNAGKGTGGGVSSFPNPLLFFSLHHLNSCQCQQVSFYNSFIKYQLEVLHTYISFEITVVMMLWKLYKQFFLKANI